MSGKELGVMEKISVQVENLLQKIDNLNDELLGKR